MTDSMQDHYSTESVRRFLVLVLGELGASIADRACS